MKIKSALILCAGYGKRLRPITNDVPKPLLKINNINLLDNTLKFVQSIGINNIKINTFYLAEKIKNFIESKNYPLKIDIVNDGTKILDTGGGIFNLTKHSEEEDFLIFNPDTLWNSNYINIVNQMEKYYFKNKVKNLLMVVNKNKSFDVSFKGDFSLDKNRLSKEINNEYIFTGCQILNKKVFQKKNGNIFSITEIWNDLINNRELHGYESTIKFVHLTDIKIFKKLN